MHTTAEHRPKKSEPTAAMATAADDAPTWWEAAAAEAEAEDDDSVDSTHRTFGFGYMLTAPAKACPSESDAESTVAADDCPNTASAVPDSVDWDPPGTLLTSGPPKAPPVVSELGSHGVPWWPHSYWIDGELYWASSDKPSATLYRASAFPVPPSAVQAPPLPPPPSLSTPNNTQPPPVAVMSVAAAALPFGGDAADDDGDGWTMVTTKKKVRSKSNTNTPSLYWNGGQV